MRGKLLRIGVAAALAAGAAPLLAQSASSEHGSRHAAQEDAVSIATTDGEVRKVDRESGKVTLKHGEIRNLGMPPMTMAFRVADPSILDKLNRGDRVRFRAEKIEGTLTVTAIEVAN